MPTQRDGIDPPVLSAQAANQRLGAGRLSNQPRSGLVEWQVFFRPQLPLINVGYGEDLTIHELAETVAEVAGFSGAIEWRFHHR